ncbi:MAG TPA: hypothetical protein VK507_00435 [Iamia sp.]|nr:hypothetical protein [Iamia sp.]
MAERLGVITRRSAESVAGLAVLGARPDRLAADPATLIAALNRDGAVVGSVVGAAALAPVVEIDDQVWKDYARLETIVVPDWTVAPDMLAQIDRAAGVDIAIGLRPGRTAMHAFEGTVTIGLPLAATTLRRSIERRLARDPELASMVEVVQLGRDTGRCDIAVVRDMGEAERMAGSVGVGSALLVVFAEQNARLSRHLMDVRDMSQGLGAGGSALVAASDRSRGAFIEELVHGITDGRTVARSLAAASDVARAPMLSEMSQALCELTSDLDHPEVRPAMAAPPTDRTRAIRPRRRRTQELGRVFYRATADGDIPLDAMPDFSDMAVAAAVDDAPAEVPARPARRRRGPAEARFLQAQLEVRSRGAWKRSATFVTDRDHRLGVRIAAGGVDWFAAPEPFPAAEALGKRQTVTLEVTLVLTHEGAGPPQTVEVELRREGPTDVQHLEFHLGDDDIDELTGLLQVHRGGVVYQAFRLKGPVRRRIQPAGTGHGVALTALSITADGWHPGAETHAAEVEGPTVSVAITSDGGAVTTADGAVTISRTFAATLEAAANDIGRALYDVADGVRAAEGTTAKARNTARAAGLCELARLGRQLFLGFEQSGVDVEALRGAATIRVLCTPEASVVPLELVYDAEIDRARAKPCAASVEDCRCDDSPPLDVICLRRFWGLGKVIERHPPVTHTSQAPPSPTRRPLQPLGSALFGASDKVPANLQSTTATAIGSAIGAVQVVADWEDWRSRPRPPRPSILVGIVHRETSGHGIPPLELGSVLLDVVDVRRDVTWATDTGTGPLLLLVGCETATTDGLPASFATALQSNGTPIMLGTLAPIPAEVAPAITTAIVDALAATLRARPRGVPFGAVLTEARRRLFAQGEWLGFSLIGFGDAGWVLTP